MSVEAIAWALTRAPIPRDRRDASSLAIVLVGLANHAGPDGRNAFPSNATLTEYTRLSARSVQYALRALEELGLIRPSDPEIVAAHIKRADRRPQGWDLAMERRSSPPSTQVVHSASDAVDNAVSGVQALHPEHAAGVQTRRSGAQTATSRGARSAPEPSLNHPGTSRATTPAPAEPCGKCDGRRGEPVRARVVWLDDDRVNSAPCPRCNPRSPAYPAAS
jgi:hypothetical protein